LGFVGLLTERFGNKEEYTTPDALLVGVLAAFAPALATTLFRAVKVRARVFGLGQV
jgi:hypothetical protein